VAERIVAAVAEIAHIEGDKGKTLLALGIRDSSAEGCPACKGKFTLGETVVLACGPWEGMKYIHESEAVFDKKTAMYYERRCYQAPK